MNQFVKEFQNLLLTKPRYNVKHVSAENCDYADTAIKSKNCYYCFCVFYCEDVYYARYSRKCSNCSGLTFCVECEWCVECTDCIGCYKVDNSKHCSNCSDSSYCIDCYSCKNCFGCVGMYQREYCFFNQQMSREEYEAQLAKLDLGDPEVRAVTVKALEENRKKVVNRGIHQVSCEDCIGENLSEAKGCYQCHDAFNMEDCLYNVECNGNKGCCDMTVCFEAENCYSCVQAPLNYDCNFLMHTDLCSESEFCAYSKNLKNCFGCVYLNNKQFYILNQEYSEEEYFSKIAEIKKELQNDDLYNLSLFFISEYENNRLKNEEDSAIQTILPN